MDALAQGRGAAPERLAALLGKYRTLLQLRATRDQQSADVTVSNETKNVMRQLSRAFPGCLRELDCCTQVELTSRYHAVADAVAKGAVAPWIEWMSRYHELLGLALATKTQRAAGGRLVPVVFAALEKETSIDRDTLKETLFPRRPTAPGRVSIAE